MQSFVLGFGGHALACLRPLDPSNDVAGLCTGVYVPRSGAHVSHRCLLDTGCFFLIHVIGAILQDVQLVHFSSDYREQES